MNKSNSVNRKLDFHTNPEVNHPFLAEAQFVSEQKIVLARQVLDRLTDDMQRAVTQNQEQTMLGKLNTAIQNFYEHRPELLRYAVPTRNPLFTEQLLGNGPGVEWFTLYTILFTLRAKMQTTDSAWAELGLIWLPQGGIILEYQGEYYTNEFDPAADLSLVQTRTSRPNDGFSTFLKQINKDDIIKKHNIPPENIEQVFRSLRERQIEWLSNIMLAIKMSGSNNPQEKEYLLKAYEIYPNIDTAKLLRNEAAKENDYPGAIRYSSEMLERFGRITGEDARLAYSSRAISYRELRDYKNAEKDFLACLKLAQDSGDNKAIRDAYDDLVYLACDNLQDAEKIARYTSARLNLGTADLAYSMELRRNLGLAYSVKKDWAAAIDNLLIAREIAKQLNNRQMLAAIDDSLICAAANGNLYTDDLFEIAAENLVSGGGFPFHWYIGKFNFEQQNYVEARKSFSLALNQAMSLGQPDNAAATYFWLARTAAKQQDYRETLNMAQAGLKFNNNIHGHLHLHSALAYLALGEIRAAEKAFTSSQNLFQRNGDFDNDAESALQSAKEFLLKQGRQADAAKVDAWLAQLRQTKHEQ